MSCVCVVTPRDTRSRQILASNVLGHKEHDTGMPTLPDAQTSSTSEPTKTNTPRRHGTHAARGSRSILARQREPFRPSEQMFWIHHEQTTHQDKHNNSSNTGSTYSAGHKPSNRMAAPQFNFEFNQFCRKHNITHGLTSPHNPQANGLAESAVK